MSKEELKREKGKRELEKLVEEGKLHIPQSWVSDKEDGTTEYIKCFPAGRNKKAVFKIIESEKEPPKQRNPNRMLLLSLPANPQSICFVVYHKEHKGYNKILGDRKNALVIYPERRRLSKEEREKVVASFVAFQYFEEGKKLPKRIELNRRTNELVRAFYRKLQKKFKIGSDSDPKNPYQSALK